MNCRCWRLAAVVFFAFGNIATTYGETVELKPLLEKVLAVGPKGGNHREAIAASQKLAQADAKQLPEILAGLDRAGALSANWLRAVIETVAQRELNRGGKLPTDTLEAFLKDQTHAPRSRRLAYELIVSVDATAEKRLVPSFLNDSSLELRRDAVAVALEKAAAVAAEGNKEKTVAAYQHALKAARDLDQIKAAAEKLKSLESPPDLPTHFGFLMTWSLIAPFDNTDTKGFDVAYPPETKIDLAATYDGKDMKAVWKEFTTKDDYGLVDLNTVLAKHKGAIAYATATFVSDRDRDVDLRLGSTNANKVWLNSELVFANAIYHSGREVDQYVGKAKLKKGRNQILLKIAQNEQTENWAQDWQFQFRICDEVGTAVLSQDRSIPQAARPAATIR